MTDVCTVSGLGWYVAYTAARGERTAADAIRELGRTVYLPFEKVRHKRTHQPIERPLFPRYLFVGIDPHREEWPALLEVDGVLDVIRNNQAPCRVPSAVIDRLQAAEYLCGAFDRTTPMPTAYEIGERIKIGAGPFYGHNALIFELVAKLKSATASKRVKVLINFLGRKSVIELPVEAVEKL